MPRAGFSTACAGPARVIHRILRLVVHSRLAIAWGPQPTTKASMDFPELPVPEVSLCERMFEG
jgi:hypothetical protein